MSTGPTTGSGTLLHTMLLMALPLIVLYEICIWMIWAKERKAKQTEEPEA